jgi:hypothetical protein
MDKKEFCTEIIKCLIKYGDLSIEDAQLLVSNSKICVTESNDDFDLISHETPYYWAMWLKYSKELPDWYKDPNFWPPPQEYLDRWYGSG